MNYLYITMMYINVLWTQMNRQWMYMADRCSKEFMDGVHEFIKAAEKHKYGGFVRCPCKFCKNEKDRSPVSAVSLTAVPTTTSFTTVSAGAKGHEYSNSS